MSVHEAVILALQAAALAEGGAIFTLNVGQPVNILELAERMVRLSGRVVGDEVAIEFIGARPGEKLEEELQDADEEAYATSHPAITRLSPIEIDGDQLERGIEELAHLGALGRDDSVRRLLAELTTVDAGDEEQAALPTTFESTREIEELMEPLAYPQIARRRWWLIVGLVLAAVLIVYLMTPDRIVDHYEATHVLLVEGDRESGAATAPRRTPRSSPCGRRTTRCSRRPRPNSGWASTPSG